jgi:hypothetical protein
MLLNRPAHVRTPPRAVASDHDATVAGAESLLDWQQKYAWHHPTPFDFTPAFARASWTTSARQ